MWGDCFPSDVSIKTQRKGFCQPIFISIWEPNRPDSTLQQHIHVSHLHAVIRLLCDTLNTTQSTTVWLAVLIKMVCAGLDFFFCVRSVVVGAFHEPRLRNESWNNSITSNAGVTGPYGPNTAEPGVLWKQRLWYLFYSLTCACVGWNWIFNLNYRRVFLCLKHVYLYRGRGVQLHSLPCCSNMFVQWPRTDKPWPRTGSFSSQLAPPAHLEEEDERRIIKKVAWWR